MMNANVIVAFPKMEDAKAIKAVLTGMGYNVVGCATTGAHVLSLTDRVEGGIVVCGYKLNDMVYQDLAEDLPRGFRMLLLASEKYWKERENAYGIVFTPMPLRRQQLADAMSMLIETQQIERRKRKNRMRSVEDQDVIGMAKELLMDKHDMTEDEAHHYLQKCSMDSGNSMVESARMVITIYG